MNISSVTSKLDAVGLEAPLSNAWKRSETFRFHLLQSIWGFLLKLRLVIMIGNNPVT